MLLDLEAATACDAIYAYEGGAQVKWDYLSTSGDGVYYGITKFEGYTGLVFRGSTTLDDWMEDLEALANPFDQGKLGPVHPGFFEGIEAVVEKVLQRVPASTLVVCGHSLGAARATLATALMAAHGAAPAHRVVFGEPYAGFEQAAAFANIPNSRSYRNSKGAYHDLVCDVPFSFWPELYTKPTRPIDVCRVPDPEDNWGLFAWHHMPYYLEALQKLAT